VSDSDHSWRAGQRTDCGEKRTHSVCHTDPSTGVLVHCVSGISRSGATVVAYVMATRNCSVDDALATVRAKRPVVSPNSGFKAQLHAFDAERRTGH
jgi:protein-tyrosine phosphatase